MTYSLILAGLLGLILSVAVFGWRKRNRYDRVVALGLLNSLMVLVLVALAFVMNDASLVDSALIYALLGLVGVFGFACWPTPADPESVSDG
jgi:multisubunit Na+/H+ antiporter MnhF subunit